MSDSDRGMDDLRAELLGSKKFLAWRAPVKRKTPTPTSPASPSFGRANTFRYIGKRYTNLISNEKHFSPAELAKAWGVSVDSIRRLFRDEPGVLKLGEKSPNHKRQYLTLRIPESVAERVHTKLAA